MKCPQCNNKGYKYKADMRMYFTCIVCGFTLPVSALTSYIKGRKNRLELINKRTNYVKENKKINIV